MRTFATRFLSTLLGLMSLGCIVGVADAGTSKASDCPPAAARTVMHLYEWYSGSSNAYRDQLQEREQLFDQAFYADLHAALNLSTPVDSSLEIDPFNGSSSFYGFRLESCRAIDSVQLVAHMLVKAGLAPDRSSWQPISVWLNRSNDLWRINDLEYKTSPPLNSYKLQPLLKRLLKGNVQVPAYSSGDVLITPAFRVVVERHCPEGTLLCDKVTYLGQDRSTGLSINLVGKTVYRLCRDGVTPCQFLGYAFKNGSTTYEVEGSGVLRVSKAGKVLFEEQGEWQR